ncbi:MAG: hypothetical protein OCC45_06020 [Desulfotalea sp.]
MKKKISTCIIPPGQFIFAIHKPQYKVQNQRPSNTHSCLGVMDGQPVYNSINFPENDIEVEVADWVYEIANPFPFKGVTYINKKWADDSANDASRFVLPKPAPLSIHESYEGEINANDIIAKLPSALCLALATTSTDSRDLIALAKKSCVFSCDESGKISGLEYKNIGGKARAIIHDFLLFEAVANNPHTPDIYKVAMVIRPGAQGGSEIMAEWQSDNSHAYEYLRTNSYIPGGHYAANMAEDQIRYSISELQEKDIVGLRHLYYQRSYIRLATELGINTEKKKLFNEDELENLRQEIILKIESINNDKLKSIDSQASLWGWNFGFDYAPSSYRLHASHQQVHQQYAMIPGELPAHLSHEEQAERVITPFCCGDLLIPIIEEYKTDYNRNYFSDYITAIKNNKRFDDRTDLESSLIIHEDENIILFVPKAQTSQWELQIITKPQPDGTFIGNILEAKQNTRDSIDKAILTAQKALSQMGAKLVTSIEYNKRFTREESTQPLIYALLPRLPESPGAFSEAQMRFINGHYPEDFATACRAALKKQC